MGDSLGIPALQRAYGSGATTPSEVVTRLYPALEAEEGTFITLAPLPSLLERCRWAPLPPLARHCCSACWPSRAAAEQQDPHDHV